MFSFIISWTSIIMVVRRSFIIPVTWSFQFWDFSESERVMSSWISSVVVLWFLSLYSEYSFSWFDPLPPRLCPLPLSPPHLAYAPFPLPLFECWSDDGYPVESVWWLVGVITWGGVPNCFSLCWNDVIGSSSSSNIADLDSLLLLLLTDVTDFVSFLLWRGCGVSLGKVILVCLGFRWIGVLDFFGMMCLGLG